MIKLALFLEIINSPKSQAATIDQNTLTLLFIHIEEDKLKPNFYQVSIFHSPCQSIESYMFVLCFFNEFHLTRPM
jgi:hypothetical protein